jgi:predicted alpha/beta-fold hydrolase
VDPGAETAPRIRRDDFPPFRPRPPWLNGDLQTIRNFVRNPNIDLSPFPAERLTLPMRDGTGDALIAELNRPPSTSGKPLAVLVHGLTGCADSTYMRATAAALLRDGHPVLRLNLRGAGPSRALCREHYHAGRSQDLRDALAALPAALVGAGVLAVGYSLGGNMLLKYLAEQGRGGPVAAAASVSAPIDLKATSLRFLAPRNRVYHDWLLRRMKAEALGPKVEFSPAQRAALRRARRVYDYDDWIVAPRNGFAGAEDYYARCSALDFMPKIAVPTLVIHALDDPWIPDASYAGFAWHRHPALVPLLPERGGHVGFHGVGSKTPWHDRCVALFFDRLAGAATAH